MFSVLFSSSTSLPQYLSFCASTQDTHNIYIILYKLTSHTINWLYTQKILHSLYTINNKHNIL